MNVTISEGTSFIISDETGDVVSGKEAGLYYQDTRFLSRYEILLNGNKPVALTGRPIDYYSAIHELTNPETDHYMPNSINISRKRFVGDGLHEDIDVYNYGLEPIQIEIRLEFDTDFADVFEVKSARPPTIMPPKFIIDEENREMIFRFQAEEPDGFYRETRILFGEQPKFDKNKKAATFNINLQPKRRWHTCIDFLTLSSPEMMMPKYSCGSFEMMGGYRPEYQAGWIRKAPKLFTDYDILQHAYDQGLLDMAALRLKNPEFTRVGIVPAAGIPWYVTCFGRDSIITAYQTLPYLPDLAFGVLRKLAEQQGREVNPSNEEEPGKIMHEIRWGRFTQMRLTPYARYYGTIDATPLFIILLSEVYKWTADKAFIEELKEPLLKALEWIDEYGDKDGDGYVEYKKMSEKGLDNQGWKDVSVKLSPPIRQCGFCGYLLTRHSGGRSLDHGRNLSKTSLSQISTLGSCSNRYLR